MPRYAKHALLLVNPVSGRKLVQRYLTQIIRSLMDAGYLLTTVVTAAQGEATEMAAAYGGSMDLVVCAGGDGTLNETISGLAKAELHVPVGYIPCGSTNDFANSHSLTTDIPTAVQCIAAGHRSFYDVGRFGERYFAYLAAFGAFSWMGYSTDQELKNQLGLMAYLLELAKDFGQNKAVHMRFTVDGKVYEDDYIFGAITNTGSVVGILELPKDFANTCDGKVELFLVREPKNLLELESVIRCLMAEDFNNPLLTLVQGEKILVENPEGRPWSLDGESSGEFHEATVSVLPGFLELQG